MVHADFLLLHAGQLLTIPGGRDPRRGPDASRLGIVEDGAFACRGGKVVWTGPSDEVTGQVETVSGATELDACGGIVLPGFVDPHTHPVFSGTREMEFAMRAGGSSYQEIAASGGGIASTVRTTREASRDTLAEALESHLLDMLRFGTTTAEVKSGYALDRNREIESLELVAGMARSWPQTLVPTFMGLHAVPAEYSGRSDEYVAFVTEQVLPEVASRKLARFADVFCEQGAFDAVQSARFIDAAIEAGLGVRIHADEFTSCGGAELAAAKGAFSADHLLRISSEGLSALSSSSTIAILLPGTAFFLGLDFPDGRLFLDSGAAVALATDFNPGSCYCPSMPFIISTAVCRCGFTVEEAIVCSTANGAAALDLGGVKGTLQPGSDADFTIWDLDDYRGIPYHLAAPDILSVHASSVCVWNRLEKEVLAGGSR